ncbi:prepilin-type N-terminal cleavage/methylation domain-containing protein [Pseudomonas sp. PDM18]|uniref:type IV pilin protein n=1 Tax=Pseudomonas sp. PDM18 TaxID=2769253 RepID=UPI00178775DD|nr:type IV pilin protein [Pseudomonas sp. PDM18]MBD9676893.1 prepilin-type N-terminal cleavage/methylation domain-containing protein [Pseudomonas sp. PDM18]
MHKEQGFTLVELMIVVIVVGVLTAIAFPSYQAHIRRGACEDGKGVLLGAANVMERYRAQNNTYSSATAADLGAYQHAPIDGSRKNFDIALSDLTDTGYTLTATATADGVLTSGDELELNSSGARIGTGTLINAWNTCSNL